MDLAPILIFVISLVSNEIFRTIGFQSMVGHIQVLRKHPKLRECVYFMFPKTGYFKGLSPKLHNVGGRISTSDGKCKRVTRVLGLNETIGGGYFKYISIKEKFNPPMIINDGVTLSTAVIYHTGAKVTVTFRTQKKLSKNFSFSLDGYMALFRDNRVWFENSITQESTQNDFVVDTTKICEVSWLDETNATTLYVNGVKIGILRISIPELVYYSSMEINNLNQDNRIVLDSFRVAQNGSFYPE